MGNSPYIRIIGVILGELFDLLLFIPFHCRVHALGGIKMYGNQYQIRRSDDKIDLFHGNKCQKILTSVSKNNRFS